MVISTETVSECRDLESHQAVVVGGESVGLIRPFRIGAEGHFLMCRRVIENIML